MKNLRVVDPTFNSLTARWDPAVGNVRSYKVFYKPEGEDEERMVTAQTTWSRSNPLKSSCFAHRAFDFLSEQEEVSGGTTSTTLRNLDPDTVYSVAVVPVYPDVDGIREEEKGKTSEFLASFMRRHDSLVQF